MREPHMAVPRGRVFVTVVCASLALALLTPVQAEVLAGAEGATLEQEPQVTPSELAADAVPGLKYADPTEGLSLIDPPSANSGGGAQVSYPLVVPQGRGLTPELSIDYDSGGGGSWVGHGWSIGVGEISVDTAFGVPKFCPRTTKPLCGNVESESYRLDGELLSPTAVTSAPSPRVSERSDFTRQVESTYDRIVRHGTSPKNYTWEVTDKTGNIYFYGMQPDNGGPLGGPGTRKDPNGRNDLSLDRDSILFDDDGNAMTWYLKAMRDVGVNMMRYFYTTVYFKAIDGANHSTTWTAVPKSDCDAALCARHVYLSKIQYTGVAEATPNPTLAVKENPAYEIEFLRAPDVRDDAVLDARGGFLDLDGQLLTDITVRYLHAPKLVTTYHLTYGPGTYGKQQLAFIDQVGCAGTPTPDTCDESTKARHAFTYYDETKGKTLHEAASWDTGDDDLGAKSLENRASALGMSATNAGDGHLYLGFNPLDPAKTGSFGGSLTFGGGSTESLVEFMDINGDSLPDKVFRRDPDLTKDSTLAFALNTSKPTDAANTAVTFGAAKDIAGVRRLPIEHEAGFGAGIEVYFGVFGMLNVSGQWNWSEGYFNDVNGDGLPDFVTGGRVRFNHLECTDPLDKATCTPTFAESDTKTRVPLSAHAPTSRTSDPDVAARRQLLRDLSPQVDTVRRWVAPYGGKVTINSGAALLPCVEPGESAASCPPASVRLAIQKDGAELATSTVSTTGQVWSTKLEDVDVAKGTALYFRMGADPDSEGRKVAWDPAVTYTSFTGGSGPNPPTDANGLSQKAFQSSTDFTLAGRPGAQVNLPAEGTARFEAILEKGNTSDDIRPTVVLRDGAAPNAPHDEPVEVVPVGADLKEDPSRVKSVSQNASGQFCVADGGGTAYGCFADDATATEQLRVLTKRETGLFALSSSFDVAAPVKNDKGVVIGQDGVATHLAVDSPIDLGQLTWATAPRLCYVGDNDECDGGVMDLVPPVDTDIYPQSTADGPRTPWTAPDTEDVTLEATFDVGSLTDVTDRVVTLTVKTSHDGYVLKEALTVDPVLGKYSATVTLPAKDGTSYWIDASVRNPALAEQLSNARIKVTPKDDPTEDLPLVVGSTGRQGIFPLAYRGWAAAGYLGNEGRGSGALLEPDFVVTQQNGKPFENKDDACQALMKRACMNSDSVAGMQFPGSYSGGGNNGPAFDASAVKSNFSKAYAFLPAVTPTTTGVTEEWQGPNAHLGATAAGLKAALLGGAVPSADAAGGTLEPPTLEGSTGPAFAVTGGVGPLGVSFGFGWSRSFVDYLDMNGDGFPDKVTTDLVTYTNPRGGQACSMDDATAPACEGPGVDAVNMDTTLAIGGGFSGSPVGIKGNVHGVTNSSLGSSSSKGGQTSADEYGAGIGAGFDISASFGSPNTADPNWDSNKVSSDSSKIPGKPLSSDSGLATQRTLADVNGDGLPDKIQASPAGIQVWFNLGYGFATTPVPWATGGFSTNEGYAGGFSFGVGFSGPNKDFSGGVSRNASINFPRYSWTDVNGDGILDALHRDDSNGTVKLAYGTGTGLAPEVNLGADDAVAFRLAGEIKVPIKGQIRQDQSVGYGGGADVTIGFGPLCFALCYLIVNPGAHFENSLSVSDVTLEDVNGDGYADSVQRVPAAADQHQEKLQVQINTRGRTGLLKSVSNPMHGSFTLAYQRDGNSIDHPGSVWTLSGVTTDDGRPGDGLDTSQSTFTYSGLRYDFLRREELGFARVDTSDLDENGKILRVTRDEYANTDVFDAGQLLGTTLWSGPVSDNHMVQRTTNSWTTLEGPSGLELDRSALSTDEALAMWVRPLLTSTVHDFADAVTGVVGQSTRVDYTFDSFGDPTTIADRGTLADPGDDIVATVTYSDCTRSATDATLRARCAAQANQSGLPAYWKTGTCPTWVNTPATITVTDAQGNVLRHRDGSPALCDNNSVTLLRQLISGSVGSGDYAETDLAYDDYGSYDRIVHPLGNDGTRYAVHYVYDAVNAANVAEVTDYELSPDDARTFIDEGVGSLSLSAPSRQGVTSTATFDGPSGRVATTRIAGQPATSFSYDALGRLSLFTAADGDQVRYAYHPAATAYGYATAAHDDRANAGQTIDTASFVDGMGRVTQQKREAAFFAAVDRATQAGFVVSGGVAHDAVGRDVKQFHPRRQVGGSLTTFDPTPAGALATTNVFDALDRVTSSTAPGARTTTTTFTFAQSGGVPLAVESEKDPLGRISTTSSDVRGNVLSIADTAIGKTPLTTAYGYSRMGELTSVRSAGITQSEHSYDLLGRRLSTSTTDGGTVRYGYDAAGNQVSSESSVQREAQTATDYGYSFGHLVSVDYGDSTPSVRLTWGGYDGASPGTLGAGRLTAVHDGARVQSFGYDVNGGLATQVDTMVDDHWKLGAVTTRSEYDYLGRLLALTYPDRERVTNGYDAGGSLSSVRGTKNCTDLGTLTAAVDATQTTITVRETALVAPPALPATIWIGSEQLRVTARTESAGIATYTVERGINGTLLTPTAAPHAAGAALVSDAVLMCDYRYVDRLEYDEFGDVRFQKLGNGNRVQREHDASTRALSRVFGDAPAEEPAALGTLTTAVDAATATLSVREGFLAPPTPFLATVGSETVRVEGRAETSQQGVLTWTVTRGASGTTAGAHATASAVTVPRVQQNLTYAYDKAGNVSDYVNDLPADVSSLFGGASTQHYEYDGYYRVESATGSWDTAPDSRREYTQTLGYDAVTGNLSTKAQVDVLKRTTCTKRCRNDVQEGTTYTWDPIGYTSAGQHQITALGGETYSYDADGNVTRISGPDNLREMTWDSAGRMTMIVDRPNGRGGKPTYYTYDYQGQRAIEDKEAGRSWFVNPWVTVRDGTMWKNVFAGDTRVAAKFTQEDTYEGKVYFMQADLQGSTNVVSDRTGKMFQHHEYFPDGEVWVEEDSTIFRSPYQASGMYFDEDHGLSDFGARWHDARTQAFYGVDPAVFADPMVQLSDPGSVRSYAFAGNNPLANADPDGAAWYRLNKTPKQISDLSKVIEADGQNLTPAQRTSFTNFFANHQGLKGKIAFTVVDQAHKRAKFAKRWDMKPLFEMTLGFDKAPGQKVGTFKGVESVKLSVGTGPRKTFKGAAHPDNRPAAPATAAPAAPAAQAPAPDPYSPAANFKRLQKLAAAQGAPSPAAVSSTLGK